MIFSSERRWVIWRADDYFIQDCADLLIGPCNTKEDVTAMKDQQIKSILPQLKTSISEWDSDKCPAVK